jgi:hypothetical protein
MREDNPGGLTDSDPQDDTERPLMRSSAYASLVEADSSMIGEKVEKAVLALILRPKLYEAMEWPVADPDLASAGLYAWYVDRNGAAELSKGLGHEVHAGLLYVGQTGATIGSKRLARTLGERIGKDHIYGRVRSSTFRLTLASCLLDVCPLQCIGPKKLAPTSEQALSSWIRRRLSFAVYPTDDRDGLKCLEDNVLGDTAVNPPLNIERCLETPIRQSLTKLRKKLTSPDRAVRQHPRPRALLPHPASPAATERVKLHEEIADILSSSGNDEWMTTAEIAAIVNERGRYRKQNGTAVTNFQVHGRTRKYEHLFERQGSRVRLNQRPA